MALTDNLPSTGRPSNVPRPSPVPAASPHIPHAAIARLPVLHAEAAQNARLGRFVAHSVQAACLLMLTGVATLSMGGGSLQSDFVWSVLVLAGVVAMTLNYIRGEAAGTLRRTRIEVSAADLRAILLYTGFAWGAGAFLALPTDPGVLPAFAFVMGPVLLLAALLKDEGGIAAFTAPAVILAAAAGMLKPWPGGNIAGALLVGAGIAVLLFMHLYNGRVRPQQRRAA
jgi:hypothetical protein